MADVSTAGVLALWNDLGVRHEGDQREEHQKAYRVHLRFDFCVGSSARGGFEEQEEEAATVEGGEREEIEAAEVGGEGAEEL